MDSFKYSYLTQIILFRINHMFAHKSRKLYKRDEPDMPDIAGEARTRS